MIKQTPGMAAQIGYDNDVLYHIQESLETGYFEA